MTAVVVFVIELLVLSVIHAVAGTASDVFVSVFILIFSVAYFVTISKDKVLKRYTTQLVIGYVVRLFYLYFDLYGKAIYTLPNSGADSEMFFRTSVLFANTGYENVESFSKVMGTLFSFVGPSRLYGQFVVMLFGVVALTVSARILARLDISDDVKVRVLGIMTLLPNTAIISVLFLRESVVAMLLTISAYFFIRWFQGENGLWFVAAMLFVLGASTFHSGSISVAIGYIAVLLLYDHKQQIFRFRLLNVIPTAIFVLAIVFLYNNYGEELFGKMQNVDELSDVANTLAMGGSTYAQYVGDSSTPLRMIIYTIPRMVYFLFSPFPWQWRGLSDIIAFVFSSLFYFFAILYALRSLRHKDTENRKLVIALLIVAFCAAFVFGWGVSNTGTAARHREKIVFILGLLMAASYERQPRKIYAGRRRLL